MEKPRNPFRFGPLALDEAFANREVELKELKNDAINGQDAWIVAPRRYGKSSLVWRAMQLELGPIESKPFSAFIRKRFRDAGKDVAPEVTAELLDRSGGHPYATQEFCYFLWEATSPGEVAGFPEFERALTALLRSENTHFTLLWDEASSVQRVLLQALAAEPGRPFTKEYRARHGLPPATNVQKALTALRKRDLVQPRNG